MGNVSVATCERLINGVVAQCQARPPQTSSTNLDPLAASIASQSNAIAAQANYLTLGTMILAVIAVVVAVGWGWFVKRWAEEAAKAATRAWMEQNAPGEIAKLVAAVTPSNVDGGAEPSAPLTQQEQEEGLGEEPAQDAG